MKKNSSIHIKLSSEDLDSLKRKAALCGLSLSSYSLLVLKSANPTFIQEVYKSK